MKPIEYHDLLYPIDNVAHLVTSRPEHGNAYEPILDKRKSAGHQRFEVQPKIMRYPGHASSDMTGRHKGRMTIIGYAVIQQGFGKYDSKGGARWVAKCDCGYYEYRRTGSICNPKNVDDCCYVCNDLKRIRLKARHGKLPWVNPDA